MTEYTPEELKDIVNKYHPRGGNDMDKSTELLRKVTLSHFIVDAILEDYCTHMSQHHGKDAEAMKKRILQRAQDFMDEFKSRSEAKED